MVFGVFHKNENVSFIYKMFNPVVSMDRAFAEWKWTDTATERGKEEFWPKLPRY